MYVTRAPITNPARNAGREDFSVAEDDQLRESGFKAVRLGAHVLRTETAAAYILSVVDQAAR